MEDIYGFAFSLFFDPEFIDKASLWIEYPASWFGEKSVNMITLDTIFKEGRIDMALTRTDLNEVSGYGQVAILHGIIDDIAGRHETDFQVDHIMAVGLQLIGTGQQRHHVKRFYGAAARTVGLSHGTALVWIKPRILKHTQRSFDNREWRRLSCSGKFARLQPQGQFYAT